MKNNLILKIRKYFLKHIVVLILFPIVTFSIIFISYGDSFQKFLIKNPEMYNLYELSTLLKSVNNTNIPIHIKSLAFDVVVYSYILFLFWFFLFFYSVYFNLSRNQHNIPVIFIEFITLLLIYVFIISPGLSIYIQILGWLLFLLLVIIINIYILFYNRMNNEEK